MMPDGEIHQTAVAHAYPRPSLRFPLTYGKEIAIQ